MAKTFLWKYKIVANLMLNILKTKGVFSLQPSFYISDFDFLLCRHIDSLHIHREKQV